MSREAVAEIMLTIPTLLLISMLTLAFNVQPVKAEPKTIQVLSDYTLGPIVDFTKSPEPGYYETSEYLMGSIAVGIILPESIGGAYNWTETEINQTVTGIEQAMAWWASQEPNANLGFSFDVHVQVSTIYEPIQMYEGEDVIWIEDVMSQLNYTSGSAWDKVRAYNNDIRKALGTDWAFTIFVVDSDPSVNLGLFKGGGYAHAFFGGPWVTMSRYSTWAWNAANYYKAVPAHEMGHIFYATDEYNYVHELSGYLNASDDDGTYGIMNRNSFFVSASTQLQVGWRDLDADGIMDILDTYPEIALDPYPPIIYEESYLFSGAVVEIPYPNSNPNSPRNNVTINKIIAVDYSIDNGPWASTSPIDGAYDEALENFTFTLTSPAEGIHSLKIRAINSVGNVRERIFTVETIPPDTTPPETTVSLSGVLGDNAWFTSDVTVTLSATDDNEVKKTEYSFDNASWITYTTTFTITDEGYTFVYYKSTDKAANVETTRTVIIKIDKTVPSGSIIINNGDAYTTSTSVTLTLSADDETSGVAQMRFSHENTTWTPWETYATSKARTLTTGDGTKTVYVQFMDNAGLVWQSYSDAIMLDTAPPAITITSPSPGYETKSTTITITWTGSDGTSGISHYEIRLDDYSWINVGPNTTHAFNALDDGSYTIEVKAIDNAGLTNQDSVDFIVNTSPLLGPGYTEEAVVLATTIIAAIGITLYFLKLRKR